MKNSRPNSATEIPRAVANNAVPMPADTPDGSEMPDRASAVNVSMIPRIVPSSPRSGDAVTIVSRIHRCRVNAVRASMNTSSDRSSRSWRERTAGIRSSMCFAPRAGTFSALISAADGAAPCSTASSSSLARRDVVEKKISLSIATNTASASAAYNA